MEEDERRATIPRAARVRATGAPVWVVTDQGKKFKSAEFGRAIHGVRSRRRSGAAGWKGSIVLIERF